ncbi:MAG: hypothetical protein GY849_18680, partial [Deltaproteobacteria bacterium]|nr:hypothetical protein [Deltaproteobacteria bacterium]
QLVSSGTLKIGTDSGSAAVFAAGSNDTIDATHHAYWTPASNVNGDDVAAFTVKAQDDDAALSATAVQVNVDVTDINDVPTLTAFADAVTTTNEDTQVQITLAQLKAQGNEADVDGTVDAFVVQLVSSGTLKIGTDSGSAAVFAAGSNDTIDATHHAYWTPASNVNGDD